MQKSDTQTVSINVAPKVVLDLVGDASRLPEWAPDFARAIRPDGDQWIVDAVDGEIRIVVRVSREHGTVDILGAGLPEGVEIGVFSRVVANGEGSEYSFTQFFPDELPEADVTRRKATVAGELRAVRGLCEGA
jgi:hypothetical protein